MNKSFDHKATFKFGFIASKERRMFTLIVPPVVWLFSLGIAEAVTLNWF